MKLLSIFLGLVSIVPFSYWLLSHKLLANPSIQLANLVDSGGAKESNCYRFLENREEQIIEGSLYVIGDGKRVRCIN